MIAQYGGSSRSVVVVVGGGSCTVIGLQGPAGARLAPLKRGYCSLSLSIPHISSYLVRSCRCWESDVSECQLSGNKGPYGARLVP